MGMNIWQSGLTGLISGFAELLPLSAEAHRAVLRSFMGIEGEDPVLSLAYHIAALASLFLFCRRDIAALRKARHLMAIPPRRRRREPNALDACTVRHLRTAVVIAAVVRLLTSVFSDIANKPQILAFSVMAGGAIVLIPAFVRNGNKDARNMVGLDSMLMALGSGLGAIPGLSTVGCALSAGISRGVDRKFALRFSWLLAMAGLGVSIVFDFLNVIRYGTACGILSILLGGAAAFAGSFLGCRLMKKLIHSTNCSGLGYYSIGLGLLLFVLFLTV